MSSDDTVRLIRTSERGDFKRCPWLWHEHWIKGLSPRREPTWAWFGTAIHRALEVRYPVGRKRGSRADVLDAFEEALGNETRKIWSEGKVVLEEEEVNDARTLGREMLLGYIAHYGEDSEWEVIHTEQSFQIDVHDPNTGELICVYAGTWDAFMRNIRTGALWLWDHKTRKSFLKNWDYLTINDQSGSYLWVAPEVLQHMGLMGKDDVIEGIVFNYLKKAMPDTRPTDSQGVARNKPKKEDYLQALREAGATKPSWFPAKPKIEDLARAAEEAGVVVLGEPSKVQPTPRFHREETFRMPEERATQGRRVIAEARNMQLMLQDKSLIYKTPTEDCVRCQLFEYCQLDEQDPEAGREFAAGTLRFRDPYRDHREAFANSGVSVAVEGKG